MTAAEAGCHACRLNGVGDLPAREAVYRSASWRVTHAFDTDLPGWLVALPLRHVVSISELTRDEAAELGVLLLSLALTEVVGAVKAYVAFFAEAEGFAHLHVHVVPRMPDQDTDERGPRIFARLGRPEGERMAEEEMDTVADAVRMALSRSSGIGAGLA